MKIAFLTGLLSAGVALGAAEPAATNAASTNAAGVLKNDVDKLSYSFGLNMGSNIKAQSIDVNADIICRGLQDGLGGKQPLMSPQEIQQVQDTFRKELVAKREARAKELKEKNKAEG